MNCPRCIGRGGEGSTPYRGGIVHGHAVALAEERHAAGPAIQRCSSCRGAFVEYEDLLAIEGKASRGARATAGERIWDRATPAIRCPSCTGETTRREWSIGTMLYVDICVECRGVWLDGGELETLAS